MPQVAKTRHVPSQAPEEHLWGLLEDSLVQLGGRASLAQFHRWLAATESALGYRFDLPSRHSAFVEFFGANPAVMREYRRIYYGE